MAPETTSAHRGLAALKAAILRHLAAPLRTIYWRVARPRTFGVRLILAAPDGAWLMVRHSYGDRRIWRIPGGGYRPGHEEPRDAARREFREELGLDATGLSHVADYYTEENGNRDSVAIFRAAGATGTLAPGPEIDAHAWMRPGEIRRARVTGVTIHCLDALGL